MEINGKSPWKIHRKLCVTWLFNKFGTCWLLQIVLCSIYRSFCRRSSWRTMLKWYFSFQKLLGPRMNLHSVGYCNSVNSGICSKPWWCQNNNMNMMLHYANVSWCSIVPMSDTSMLATVVWWQCHTVLSIPFLASLQMPKRLFSVPCTLSFSLQPFPHAGAANQSEVPVPSCSPFLPIWTMAVYIIKGRLLKIVKLVWDWFWHNICWLQATFFSVEFVKSWLFILG